MIEPERILYYLENVCLLVGEDPPEGEDLRRIWSELYRFCHIGTSALHSCKHPDWERQFLECEKELVASGYMKAYESRKIPA
jgi:HEPN domain-containing protein